MVLNIAFWGIYVAAVGVSLASAASLQRFVAAHPAIADRATLDQYKTLVRRQMYLALGMLVLLGAGILAGLALIHRQGLAALGAVLAANVVVFLFGMLHRRSERRVRSLPAGSPELDDEYQRVSTSWVKKAVPDF